MPVDGTNVKYEKHTYAVPNVDDTGWKRDEGNGNWPTIQYRNYVDWTDDSINEESVSKYGGFYIARYEAGVPSNANFYASKAGDAYYTSLTKPSKNVTTYTPVSKKNTQAWNYINQVNAKEVSSKMYPDGSGVTSRLIDSYAWDTVTTWLSKSDYDVTNSTDWGNYYNASFTFDGLYAPYVSAVATEYSKGLYTKQINEAVETATGVSERNKANNIYDFAGNMWEWTTETGKRDLTAENATVIAVRRGGGFNQYGSNYSASFRDGSYYADYAYFNYGFRVVLYLE